MPYQGFLPAGLTSCWTLGLALALPRMGARMALLSAWAEGAGPGCYTSRTETVLGPVDLGEEG